MTKTIIAILVFFGFITLLIPTSQVEAAACPTDYKHLKAGEDLYCYREKTTPICKANEFEKEINGKKYCAVPAPIDKIPLPAPDTALELTYVNKNALPASILNQVLTIFIPLMGFFTVIIIVISGIQFISSSGDPKSAEAAKGRLTFAIIGFIIIILAFAIAQIITRIFLNTGTI